ncbi:MAG: class I SAM-dependent methyltransferase [Spirochaetales bacterium]|nr:class I SAM-dependent methyltransferase [Spirochaetales bacterium]
MPFPGCSSPVCTLCGEQKTTPYSRTRTRRYFSCPVCSLVFLDPVLRLSEKKEKARYELHQNILHDPAYRAFLLKLASPMLDRLAPGSAGLDFGCGPGPLLSEIFREAGHQMHNYDPFFSPDKNLLETAWDFITVSETAEHLFNPGRELNHLREMLNPGGLLGIMTSFVPEHIPFSSWSYAVDPTHVCFFSEAVFSWLGGKWGTVPEFPSQNVVIFHKPVI